MAEQLSSKGFNKEEKYNELLPQLQALIEEEKDVVAALANFTAAIQQVFSFLWVGFYRVIKGELVLGPFQGPVACTRIGLGKGVCGKAWEEMKTITVPDVDAFPGHIACSDQSKSEIVIPLLQNGIVWAVLDIDSRYYNSFDETDAAYLSQMLSFIKPPVPDEIES